MSSDCIIGSAECEIIRIAQLYTESVVKIKFRDCYRTIGIKLGITLESLDRITRGLDSIYGEDVQILEKILLEYRLQKSEDALLSHFIKVLNKIGCKDFADALTKEFLTKRNDLEPNNTETEASTERNTLLPPHVLPSSLNRIQSTSTKDIQLTGETASLAGTNPENKVAWSWRCIAILVFVVFVVLLMLVLLVFYMTDWKTANPFSEHLRNFNLSTNSSYNHKISKSACGYNVEDIVVQNHEHYISKMNPYIQRGDKDKTSIFIDIKKPIYWPHDAPILQPECVQSFSVKGPLNFAVVIKFLAKSQSLQNLRLSYPNISCDMIGLPNSSSNKTCMQLKNVKNFEMQDFSDCSSILNILSKSFMMPIISRLKIAQHIIKNEDLKIVNKLTNSNTIECLEVVTPTLAYYSLHLKKYFPYLKQLELKAEKSNQHAVLFKPKNTLSLKICNKFDMLEVLKIDGWFLPLNSIWNCSSIKVLHLSLTIMRHETFNDVSIFLEFDYLKELDLHINYQSKENCPSSGLIGIDKLEHSLLKLSIKTDMCNIRNSSSNFSKSISRSTPEYTAVDNCREKDLMNVGY